MNNTERLAAIKARAEAATAAMRQNVDSVSMALPEGRFIANARQDIIWLLQEIKYRDQALNQIADRTDCPAVQAVLHAYIDANIARNGGAS